VFPMLHRGPYIVTTSKVGFAKCITVNVCHWRGHNILTEMRTMNSKIVFSVSIVNFTIETNPIKAETGKGTDIFKVIMTVFGVQDTKGDIVAIVTVNSGEDSRVKFLETEAFKPVPSNLTSLVTTPSPGSEVKTMEYVATFPNVTINAGDEYKGCILTMKDLELICKTGHNSPASRPEFLDLSLDAVSRMEGIESEE
jgi:hypothetical protein